MITLTRREFIKLVIKTDCKKSFDILNGGEFILIAGEYRYIRYTEKAYADWLDSFLDSIEYGYVYERSKAKNKFFRYVLSINGTVKVIL